jgi:hypothetical protein
MRTILAACLVIGSTAAAFISPAHAEDPYWRTHHDVEWQNRAEFKDPAQKQTGWLRDHCIRDWDGHEMCRR